MFFFCDLTNTLDIKVLYKNKVCIMWFSIKFFLLLLLAMMISSFIACNSPIIKQQEEFTKIISDASVEKILENAQEKTSENLIEVARYLKKEGVELKQYEGIQIVCDSDLSVITVYRNHDFSSLRSK